MLRISLKVIFSGRSVIVATIKQPDDEIRVIEEGLAKLGTRAAA